MINVREKAGFNPVLHLMRGMAILLVVLGHSVDPFVSIDQVKTVKTIIYSFHMPLFFFLSGFFGLKFFDVSPSQYGRRIVGQFKRLMVVYLFCSVVAIPVKLALNQYADRPIHLSDVPATVLLYPHKHPVYPLWYLYVLFAVEVLCLTVSRVRRIRYDRAIDAAAMLAVVAAVYFVPLSRWWDIFAVRAVRQFLIFFVVGFLVGRHAAAGQRLVNKLCVPLLGLAGAWVLVLRYPPMQFPVAGLLYALSGIVLTWAAATVVLRRLKVVVSVLNVAADYAYPIYVFSYFFQVLVRITVVQILGVTHPWPIALLLAAGVVCPVLLSKYVLEKSPLLRRCALGDWMDGRS